MKQQMLRRLFSSLAIFAALAMVFSSTACEKRSLKVVFPEKYEQKKAAKEALEKTPEVSEPVSH